MILGVTLAWGLLGFPISESSEMSSPPIDEYLIRVQACSQTIPLEKLLLSDFPFNELVKEAYAVYFLDVLTSEYLLSPKLEAEVYPNGALPLESDEDVLNVNVGQLLATLASGKSLVRFCGFEGVSNCACARFSAERITKLFKTSGIFVGNGGDGISSSQSNPLQRGDTSASGEVAASAESAASAQTSCALYLSTSQNLDASYLGMLLTILCIALIQRKRLKINL